MPRKAKDEEVNKEEISAKKVAKTKSTTKKATSTKKAVSTKTASKKTSSKAVSSKVANSKSIKVSSKTKSSKATSSKTSDTKKASAKSTNSKVSSSKKTSTRTSKKSSVSKTSTVKNKSKKSLPVIEYYDLPTAYNQTIVKILAQTPSCLFVYWEISKKDVANLQEQYGENFFNETKPYLVITNETMNYSFEVEINDYANSWYIHINDSSCKYNVVLIRKYNSHSEVIPSTTYITSSNEISSPNDHILFDKLGKTVFFRDVKSNVITKKDISSISFISNIGRIYNIYDLYKEIYKNELRDNELGIELSSSSSSTFK